MKIREFDLGMKPERNFPGAGNSWRRRTVMTTNFGKYTQIDRIGALPLRIRSFHRYVRWYIELRRVLNYWVDLIASAVKRTRQCWRNEAFNCNLPSHFPLWERVIGNDNIRSKDGNESQRGRGTSKLLSWTYLDTSPKIGCRGLWNSCPRSIWRSEVTVRGEIQLCGGSPWCGYLQ